MPNIRNCLLRAGPLAALLTLVSPAIHAQVPDSPPTHPFAQSSPITDRYIVVLKKDVGNPAAEAANHVRGPGAQLHHVYSTALKGFAATLPAAALAGIQNNPNVDYIEQDQTVSLTQVENGATWGLDRIDQADRPLDLLYHYNATGLGVHAFIIDTGIRPDHVEFSGRLFPGFTAIADGLGTNDCNGHGTHVAGTVGGTVWGVAKQVSLRPVRVLDCRGSGSWSGVIAGIDWVANSGLRPAVANMSLGGGKSTSVNAAVAGAVAKGVTMVVAAGNSSADACNYSPSSESSALTVGATTSGDVRASYSNYGACVDIFAPGSAITSAWNSGSSATNTISGTSMASPHVAGVSALVAQTNPTASPAAIAAFLVGSATADRIGSVGTGSPNLLLYSLGTGSAAEPPAAQIAVSALTGSWSKQGKNWRAKATVTVRNVNSTLMAMPNVTVTGSFAPGGNASCVTASNSTCTLTSAPISSVDNTSVFTLGGLSGSNMNYDPTQNSASQVTIIRP
ncbi:S8 family peptidase [Caenimonas soli]|uniref:S8 family peptidase n=1 Tax=Caenimonas soli TaxID=2735555 RepID=UPI001556661E|nr:S8 family peptidase [Caenimonas soli]NPC58959.1 S8 family serine peptidase [Caenimonas soli]